MDLPNDILSLDGPVAYVPVRHHSPTAARMVRQIIRELRPRSVLIEGPSDFNDRIDELALAHEPPLAIYSYVRRPDGTRRGAYYPFCVYSPEWQALSAAREVGSTVGFIDLPFADIARDDDRANRYADADMRRSRYVRGLCRTMGVDNFDGVWDLLFELDATITPAEYLRRAHHFCAQIRLVEGESSLVDRRREAFMAARIRHACESGGGPIVVITGGYHSIALHARLTGRGEGDLRDPPDYRPSAESDDERGIALTPYSYERLDSLKGYEAGMPNPGFYHRLWRDREALRPVNHQKLIFEISKVLRQRKQRVSSADLIAAETCATAIARLRGHPEVWRNDLIDGLTGSLIKDELASGGAHPLLGAIHEVLRGNARGTLAAGSALPPLLADLQNELAKHNLVATPHGVTAELDLGLSSDLQRSRILHRVRILGIAGYTRVDGTNFSDRDDLSRLWERWELRWSPDFDAKAIEASRYGSTLAEAAAARLAELATSIERSSEQAAILLLDASLAALHDQVQSLFARLRELVRQDGEFLSVTAALGHVLYLFRYDDHHGTAGRADIGVTLKDLFARGLWLLEILGQMIDPDGRTVAGVGRLLETFEQCETSLALERDEFVAVLERVSHDSAQGPALRGAATGALWVLGAADIARVHANLRLFSDPDQLGDFLGGLFALAREIVQRQQELILAIDELLSGYADDQFLTALPSLRLAFTYFTPREKHHMAVGLTEALGISVHKPSILMEVAPEEVARAIALESRVCAAVEKFGLRKEAR